MTRPEIARLEACQRLEAGLLTQSEVARQLGLSDRQVRRLLVRYRHGGPASLLSHRRGRPSNRRIPPALIAEALNLVRDRYPDFGPTFANEKLHELHGIRIGTETLRQAMIAAGMWQAKRRPFRRVHPPRERRPCFGELVQIDGSPHKWFEERAPRCTLLVFIDDATSALVGLRFVKVETTWAYLNLLRSYLAQYGRPLALYSDRHSIFRSTHSEYTETRETQFAQALRELDIELLCATTPQAKGRVERVNHTLQRRLVRELRLRDISTIDAANAFLPTFVEAHNQRFAVAPRCDDDLHRSTDGIDLRRALCCRYERIATNERTFQIGQVIYALDDARIRPKTRISIREQEDHTFEVLVAGRQVAYRKLRTLTQSAIVDGKVLREPFDRRVPNPKKAHTPSPDHPWRTSLAPRRLADTST